jgi:hypothetical protein
VGWRDYLDCSLVAQMIQTSRDDSRRLKIHDCSSEVYAMVSVTRGEDQDNMH